MGITVGIDPGLGGGLAALSASGLVLGVWRMPVAGGEVHASELADLLRRLRLGADGHIAGVCIEKVGAMPKQGVTSSFSFGKGCGKLEGVCATLGLPVTLVPPTVWKKRVLVGLPHDKEGAVRFCTARWPLAELIPNGCRKPHDGIADALCLAEYLRGRV